MSRVSPRAVSITIGTVDSARSRRQTSNPSSPGSIRSSSTRSGDSRWKAGTASVPLWQKSGSMPSLRSTMPSISARSMSSSTTSTRAFTPHMVAPVGTGLPTAVHMGRSGHVVTDPSARSARPRQLDPAVGVVPRAAPRVAGPGRPSRRRARGSHPRRGRPPPGYGSRGTGRLRLRGTGSRGSLHTVSTANSLRPDTALPRATGSPDTALPPVTGSRGSPAGASRPRGVHPRRPRSPASSRCAHWASVSCSTEP